MDDIEHKCFLSWVEQVRRVDTSGCCKAPCCQWVAHDSALLGPWKAVCVLIFFNDLAQLVM